MTDTVITHIARLVDARLRCLEKNGASDEWFQRHSTAISTLVAVHLPSGSGWDASTKIDLAKSKADKIVLYGAFHHMDENGMYDGWTEHEIIITPSLQFGFDLRITGRDRNQIKDYLHEIFDQALRQNVTWDGERWKVAA